MEAPTHVCLKSLLRKINTEFEMGQNLQASGRNSFEELQPLLIVDKRFENDAKNRRQFSTNEESFKCSYNGLGSLAHNLTFK